MRVTESGSLTYHKPSLQQTRPLRNVVSLHKSNNKWDGDALNLQWQQQPSHLPGGNVRLFHVASMNMALKGEAAAVHSRGENSSQGVLGKVM